MAFVSAKVKWCENALMSRERGIVALASPERLDATGHDTGATNVCQRTALVAMKIATSPLHVSEIFRLQQRKYAVACFDAMH
jgi:hypothetical protein